MLKIFIKEVFTIRPLTINVQILSYEKFYAIYLKSNIQLLIFLYLARHVPQFKILTMLSLSDVWSRKIDVFMISGLNVVYRCLGNIVFSQKSINNKVQSKSSKC